MAKEKQIIGEAEIKNEIKLGVSGGYFFFGDEDYLKSYYAKELEKSITNADPFGEFNKIIMYADTFSARALDDALATLPMMSEKKIVELVSPNIAAWRENEKADFIAVLEKLSGYPHSVLLVTVNKDCFDEGNLPKRPSSMFKQISQYLTPVQFALQSEAKLARWLERRCAAGGSSISDRTATDVVRYCGRDMRNLAGEADKLIAYTVSHGRSEIAAEDIPVVCSAGETDDSFELANAVISGDRARALSALLRCKQKKEEPIAVFASVEKTVGELLSAAVILEDGGDKKDVADALKIHEYKAELYKNAVTGVNPDRLRAALERCRTTDLQLKSTTLGYIAIERFVATIPQLSKIRE